MRISRCLVVFAFWAASLVLPAMRLNAGNNSTITVAVTGLNCTTSAGSGTFNAEGFSFGAENSGRASLQNLNVSRMFDGCSAALFGATVAGTHLTLLSLTQKTTATPPIATMTIHLKNVVVTNYQISGTLSAQYPTETVSFTFAQITITDPQNNSSFCWDLTSGTECTPF